MLVALGKGQGYLKAGFLGFPKSGKSYTAMQLAIGTRSFMKHDGPIGMFDTEGGSEYLAAMVREQTGKDLLGVKGRSFDDLLTMAKDCEKEKVSVMMVDSITHPWRELCDAFLLRANETGKKKAERFGYEFKPIQSLEFQHWGIIKRQWAKWTDWYLNSQIHVIICGRAGYEYDHEETQDGKKTLVKTGTKMKVEAEFGFEPSLLVEMERVEVENRYVHQASVLGDRFNVIDGKQMVNPRFDFFKPHVAKLVPDAHAPIDTGIKTSIDIDETGTDEWSREKRQRTILAEEIKGELLRSYPSESAEHKQAKAGLLEMIFGTRSWTKISEATDSKRLEDGLHKLRDNLNK